MRSKAFIHTGITIIEENSIEQKRSNMELDCHVNEQIVPLKMQNWQAISLKICELCPIREGGKEK